MFTTDHEAICYCHDVDTQLQAIIAIHSTVLGPGLGGIRIYPYASEQLALEDVLDLSRAMTYKAAAADLPFGGAKAVVLCDPKDPRKPDRLKALCRFINLFQGNFQTGEDMGSTTDDMIMMRNYTQYVTYASPTLPDYLETSSLTARGVRNGIQACLQQAFGSPELSGRKIAIQGAGKVGSRLARLLKKEGAAVTISDLDAGLARSLGSELQCNVVSPEEIFSVETDVFSPCAIGRIVSERTLPQMRALIVAGAANNQLAAETMAGELQERRVIYAPDFVINAGGLMSATFEMGIEDEATMLSRVDSIGTHLLSLFAEAAERKTTPLAVVQEEVRNKLRAPRL